jgi:hypothetical protein
MQRFHAPQRRLRRGVPGAPDGVAAAARSRTAPGWFALAVAAALLSSCGASGGAAQAARASAPGKAGVIAAVSETQRAVRARDVGATCESLVPPGSRPTSGAKAGAQQGRRRLEAAMRECKREFGRHGEFAALRPGLEQLTVSSVTVHGADAVAHVRGPRGRANLALVRLAGRWRLLFNGR